MRWHIRCGAGLAAVVLLAGCSAPTTTPGPPPDVAMEPTLIQRREAAGIADCPVTEADAPAVPGGLPDVILGCLGSTKQVNLAGLRGKPLVINFWAQWCAPCRAEAPHLKEFAARAGDDVGVFGVDFADPDPGSAIDFAQYAGWTYPQFTDPLKRTAGPIRFTGIPVTIFVDAQGRIVHRTVGAVGSTQQLLDATRQYLGVTL